MCVCVYINIYIYFCNNAFVYICTHRHTTGDWLNNLWNNSGGGGIPRRWRYRTGRPLPSPQIHQKIICMWSNFHKTTSKHWGRIPDTQKSKPISWKWGRTKYKDKKGNKGFRDRDPFWGRSSERSFHNRKPSKWSGQCGALKSQKTE